MLHVVDYKATSSTKEITLEDEWKQAYKRQMEIYQWLLRRNGFTVSDTGYFVYVNADRGRATFDSRLHFAAQIIPYNGGDFWVERAVFDAYACLMSATAPMPSSGCVWCSYRHEGETGADRMALAGHPLSGSQVGEDVLNVLPSIVQE
jgi:hypothetical protein